MALLMAKRQTLVGFKKSESGKNLRFAHMFIICHLQSGPFLIASLLEKEREKTHDVF